MEPDVHVILVTFLTSLMKAFDLRFHPRMLDLLVALKGLSVVEAVSAEDAVEVLQGRGWHLYCQTEISVKF